MKQEDSTSGIWKAMIVSSFIMLSMMTWAASPLLKLVEKVQHKETVKAKLKVCTQLNAMLPVYRDWTNKLFSSGCIYQVRSFLFALAPEREAEIKQQWKDQEGLDWDKWMNVCQDAASRNERDNRITDRVLTPIYFEDMNCPEVVDEAKKLGVEVDDV